VRLTSSRATLAYNVVEAAVALTAGVASSSSALIGFGLDSVVEVLSRAAIAWQFAGGQRPRGPRAPCASRGGVLLLRLAVVVAVDAVRSLLVGGARSTARSASCSPR
jgi:hypothetical protein